MAKIGENVSVLVDKTVDFTVSSQAFRKYLNKISPRNVVPSEISQENAQLYLQRLAYHRRLYRLQQGEK